MVMQLRALATLLWDQGLAPSTLMVAAFHL